MQEPVGDCLEESEAVKLSRKLRENLEDMTVPSKSVWFWWNVSCVFLSW